MKQTGEFGSFASLARTNSQNIVPQQPQIRLPLHPQQRSQLQKLPSLAERIKSWNILHGDNPQSPGGRSEESSYLSKSSSFFPNGKLSPHQRFKKFREFRMHCETPIDSESRSIRSRESYCRQPHSYQVRQHMIEKPPSSQAS